MMHFKRLFSVILVLFLVASCSKQEGKTTAKLKLNLSGVVDITSGIGSGGAILFGKSSTGSMFGKKIISPEENLDIPNGAWTFYALMWDTAGGALPMNGKIHCGKTAIQLNGTAATIAMSLNNSQCSDPEFSAGKFYVSGGNNRFADIFIEECDEVNGSTGFSCGLANQGSALSYRFVFNSFKKSGEGIIFDPDPLVSECKMIDSVNASPNIYFSGLPINFPSGNGVSPFIGSIEFFMGNVNCIADSKGVHRFPLHQGAGNATSSEHRVLVSNNSCTPSTPDFLSGTNDQKKDKCELFFGSWDGSNCNGTFLPVVTRFANAGVCGTQVAANVAIKHQFKLPKPALCGPYIDISSSIGSHPFAAGEGSTIRPYKICTEWQLNQIGDSASAYYLSNNFKLMNDLDMNKTDFGSYTPPTCAGASGSLLKGHHNLNPLDKIVATCNSALTTASGFTGVFNGNGKTISNGRIAVASSVDNIGFVRKLGSSGEIKNLKFNNLEVEGRDNIGSVAGFTINSSNISNVKSLNADIRGNNKVGGLIGDTNGALHQSMFRGSIEHYQASAGYSIGGLVGNAGTGSVITSSFSEGVINSAAHYTGGIAGSNSGTITDVYSNMYIHTRFDAGSAMMGGIVGSNSNSNILNVYSDSVLESSGGGSPVLDGIVAAGSLPSNTTVCHASSPRPYSTCAFKSHANLRLGNNSMLSGSAWISNVPGTLPRLAWESRACHLAANQSTVSNQSGALGRGSLLNPIIICTSDQLKALNGGSAFYRLVEDINISDWTDANMLTTFSGNFDGNDFALYGLNVTSSASFDGGILRDNLGVIKNLNLIGNKIFYTGTGVVGILTGRNNGTIKNVSFTGNTLDGLNYVGVVAGINLSGASIDSASVNLGKVNGITYVGGVSGLNEGTILRSSSDTTLSEKTSSTNYSRFGGVAGENSSTGVIDQVVFSGKIEFVGQAGGVNATSIIVGGITGYNAGAIDNAMTKNYSRIKVQNYTNVGGLVGQNVSGGNIGTSFSLGSVVFDKTGAPIAPGSTFHQLVGNNAGTIESNTYFLEKHAGALIGSPITSAACTGSTASFSGLPSYLLASSIDVDLLQAPYVSGGGDSLTNYISFPSPSSNYTVNYTGACNVSAPFKFFLGFEPNTTGKKVIADFGNITNFPSASYNIAYIDSVNSVNSIRPDELIDLYEDIMAGRTPSASAPIWELNLGDSYPNLIQVNDR